MPKGEKQWNNLDVAFKNYLAYIKRKSSKYELTIIDLLYTSNFKGGNASIVATESYINEILNSYAEILQQIANILKGN